MSWLISANGKLYDHASSFAHFGSIDWRQGNVKYRIGETVYIYCTQPIKSIRYKCSITALNKKFSEIRNDKDYWLNQAEYEKSLDGIFFNLKLLEEVNSEKLSLAQLELQGLKAAPQSPMRLKPTLEAYIAEAFNTANDEYFPETLSSTLEFYEGMKKQVSVNKYERSSIARAKCIDFYKSYKCQICEFDFERFYGEIGKNFIHVHHITPIHLIGENYKINYANDLLPVCPNCHAMLHKKINNGTYSVSELRELIKARRAQSQI